MLRNLAETTALPTAGLARVRRDGWRKDMVVVESSGAVAWAGPRESASGSVRFRVIAWHMNRSAFSTVVQHHVRTSATLHHACLWEHRRQCLKRPVRHPAHDHVAWPPSGTGHFRKTTGNVPTTPPYTSSDEQRHYSGLINQSVIAAVIFVVCITSHEHMKRKRRGKHQQEGLGSVESWQFG